MDSVTNNSECISRQVAPSFSCLKPFKFEGKRSIEGGEFSGADDGTKFRGKSQVVGDIRSNRTDLRHTPFLLRDSARRVLFKVTQITSSTILFSYGISFCAILLLARESAPKSRHFRK